MTRRRLLTFVAGTLAAAALTHGVFAITVAAAADRLYAGRMFDVRKWPGTSTEGFRLAGTYLRERFERTPPPVTLFAGSSVTHGYPWTHSQTFAQRYADARGTPVINAGILALDASGINDWIICAALRNRLRPRTLIIELPVVNTVSQLVNYHRAGTPVPPLSNCTGVPPDSGYAAWTWSRPLAIGWFVFLWEQDAYPKPDAVIRVEPVPRGYFTGADDFNRVAATYDAQIAGLLANARRAADEVYVFASPVFTAGFEQIGEDAAAMRAQLARTVAACAQAGGATCLDASFLGSTKSYFINFTHLSQAGHRALAEWLAGQVR